MGSRREDSETIVGDDRPPVRYGLFIAAAYIFGVSSGGVAGAAGFLFLLLFTAWFNGRVMWMQ